MIEDLNKGVKKLDIWDIALTKLTVVAGVLFLITIWPALMDLVLSVKSPWYFLVAFVIIAIRPTYRFYIK